MKFETDYIITWDISDKDFPTITVGRLREENGKILFDILGITHEKSGAVSLLQLLAEDETKNKQ